MNLKIIYSFYLQSLLTSWEGLTSHSLIKRHAVEHLLSVAYETE